MATPALVLGIPAVEFALAHALLVTSLRRAALAISGGLLAIFAVYLTSQLFNPAAPPCGCFGQALVGEDAWTQNAAGVARNLILIGVAWAGFAAQASPPLPSLSSAASTRGRRYWQTSCSGFSLVELLVVVGVVGVLLAILLPTLSAVRAAGRTTACSSQMRQIAAGALNRASEHEGYLPPAGTARLHGSDDGYGTLPVALADPRRRRYAYTKDVFATSLGSPTRELVTPFPIVIDDYLHGEGPVEIFGDVLLQVRPTLGLWLCPDAAVATRQYHAETSFVHRFTHSDVAYSTIEHPSSDYALNGALLGFHHKGIRAAAGPGGHPPRLRGRLTAVSDASTRVLLFDADLARHLVATTTADPGYAHDEPDFARFDVIDHAAGVTLADVAALSPGPVGWSPRLDRSRHRERVNVAYVDGHVAADKTSDLAGAVVRPGQ